MYKLSDLVKVRMSHVSGEDKLEDWLEADKFCTCNMDKNLLLQELGYGCPMDVIFYDMIVQGLATDDEISRTKLYEYIKENGYRDECILAVVDDKFYDLLPSEIDFDILTMSYDGYGYAFDIVD